MNRLSLILTQLITLLVIFGAVTKLAFAYSVPTFPSCINPQGSVRVEYATGTHGIVGDTATYVGSDKVYDLTTDTQMQCLCPENGQGIQTNWWNVSALSAQDMEDLKKDGWMYIPDGSAWGLNSAPYLAKNSTYTCRGEVGGSNNESNNSSSSSSNNSNSSNNTTSSVGQVLGLASTGDIVFIYILSSLGVILLATAYCLRKIYDKSTTA